MIELEIDVYEDLVVMLVEVMLVVEVVGGVTRLAGDFKSQHANTLFSLSSSLSYQFGMNTLQFC